MKQVLLLGDSIRMGYTAPTAELLKDIAEVSGPAENGRWSGYTLNTLRFWKADLPTPDVIHLNCGLWDMGDDYGFGRPFTLPEQYQENLHFIIRVLREYYPGAPIIMATTTPTLDRDQNVIRQYNELLKEVAAEENIPVNDLYAVFAGQEETYVCPDKLHLTKEGFELAAKHVAEVLKQYL